MNRYPLWVYLVMIVALAIGLVYTAPNFFPEVPAVQVSSAKTTVKIDEGVRERVEAALKAAGVQADFVRLEGVSVRARFADIDTQTRARDAVQKALNPDAGNPGYVVALNLLSSAPQWLSSINALPMYKGLDLRGGVHFLMQVDMNAALAKRAESFVADVRNALREKNLRHDGVARTGNGVQVRFLNQDVFNGAQPVLAEQLPDLQWTPSTEGGEYRLSGVLKPEAARALQDQVLKQNITTLRNRVNELAVSEPVIQQQGADRIVVQLPGVQDTAKAKDIIGRTATLEVRMVVAHMLNSRDVRDYDPTKVEEALRGIVPPGAELLYSRADREGDRPEPLLVSKQVVFSGDNLTDAAPNFDQQTQGSVVSVRLDGKGAAAMKVTSREAVKRRMAVILIERGKQEVLTAPTIQSELSGQFQITGMANPQEASDLALLMRAGALAAPMDIIEEKTIGPSLGAENIEKGFLSVQWGFAAIALFMCAYYLLFGVFSTLALGLNLLLLVALLSMLQATLTLPGMAAIALTLGMAIDANVLINERVREELRAGASPQAAIHTGYERAWGTILDSNVTTLIAGVALLAFGSGPVKGFAVVHCLGILTSMFSAVVFSRGLVNLWYGRKKKLQKVSIGQVWRPGGGALALPQDDEAAADPAAAR
jgi:preprotein translocase subunit SecD